MKVTLDEILDALERDGQRMEHRGGAWPIYRSDSTGELLLRAVSERRHAEVLERCRRRREGER